MLCNGQINQFLDICQEINFPIAPEKTEWVTTVIVFLGFLINTVTQTISIPLDKRMKALEQLEEILLVKKMTIKKLQKMTGLLNFISRAIVPGRTFMRRMYAKFTGRNMMKLKPHYNIKIDKELKANCMSFLMEPESICRPFIDFNSRLLANEINFYTDASGAED